jgi:8-oxo-dGTP pyrophosphatase MutT (NUDIX family)
MTASDIGRVVAPRPAATVLLVRDGADGLEVLMVTRHVDSGFAAGARVFPGGKVDEIDRVLAARLPHAEADEEAAAFAVAAVRELWEETGILLAYTGESRELVDAIDAVAMTPGATLADLVERRRCLPAVDLLVPFAHWVTPESRPRRFDTRFFLAPYDGDQRAVFDGYETVEVGWVTPARALAEADAGSCTIVLPTRMNLELLGTAATVAEALASARRRPLVRVLPEVCQVDGHRVVRIPENAGYGVGEIVADHIAQS